jgi:hypothetical protein
MLFIGIQTKSNRRPRHRSRGEAVRRLSGDSGEGQVAVKHFLLAAKVTAIAVSVVFGVLATPRLHAQSSATEASPPAFEVASVKSNLSNAPANSRFPLGPGDAYVPGAIFSATNQPLIGYLRFAYKLGQSDLLGLPGWVYSDRFDIEARAQGNPTKDHMRLMMQSLLTDRFTLIAHTERQIKPVFNLVLAKSGKTGPQLQAHWENESCSTASTSPRIVPASAERLISVWSGRWRPTQPNLSAPSLRIQDPRSSRLFNSNSGSD